MRHWPSPPRKKSRIEIIPMIDVMMFLLVFFVLISLNVIPALGLKTKLPTSAQARDERPPLRVVVTLPKNEGLQIDGKDVSLAELGPLLDLKRAASSKNLSVLINGDEDVQLQRLIDVMDVLRARGFENFSIAAKKR